MAARIRFTINAPASKANGLNVSAKLLVLARPG
ncbi:MAG: YfiR/HmsC family protein [Fibrobacteria bacterium]